MTTNLPVYEKAQLAGLHEELGRLRLCDAAAMQAMERSLLLFGQIAPLLVHERPGGYEVVDGFKRLRAARALKWCELWVQVVQVRGAQAHRRQRHYRAPHPRPPVPHRSPGPSRRGASSCPQIPDAETRVDPPNRSEWIRFSPPSKLRWTGLQGRSGGRFDGIHRNMSSRPVSMDQFDFKSRLISPIYAARVRRCRVPGARSTSSRSLSVSPMGSRWPPSPASLS